MIYVIRHGESVVNVERRLKCKLLDGDLTEKGRQQAQQVAVWLQDKEISHIYHSAFHRAAQTAQIIGKALNVTPQEDAHLGEMDCGELEGHTDNYSWGVWQQVWERWLALDWHAAFPGGESFREAYERISLALTQAAEHPNSVLITHGGIIRSIIPLLCVNHAALQRAELLANGGIVVLETYNHTRYICNAWNIVEHLQ